MLDRKGIITSDSRKGFFFAEDLGDHVVFVHQRNVEGARFLHVNDIITFDHIDSLKQPGKFEAINIRYSGHGGGDAAVRS
jgi:cold shock CspA family protein